MDNNNNIICTANFDINQRPAVEAGEWAKWQDHITQHTNAAALRYSRTFTDEEQRKHFMQGVAYATQRVCAQVIAGTKR
jgi:hypothetical protein|tara:strand:+ start:591 stop:827 length:237 start_codon:yes stop_codon:yes gene_type:complete